MEKYVRELQEKYQKPVKFEIGSPIIFEGPAQTMTYKSDIEPEMNGPGNMIYIPTFRCSEFNDYISVKEINVITFKKG